MRLLLALCLFWGVAMAGEARLTCTAPTENTDGSELTDLAGYRFHYGTDPQTLVQTVQVGPEACGATITNLSPGTWYFAARAFTADAQSDLSNVASKVITDAPPNPPSDLRVEETTVYQVIGTRNAFALIPVGTVPADTPCNPDQSVNGHYGVARELVTWFGNVKPQSVVAKCF